MPAMSGVEAVAAWATGVFPLLDDIVRPLQNAVGTSAREVGCFRNLLGIWETMFRNQYHILLGERINHDTDSRMLDESSILPDQIRSRNYGSINRSANPEGYALITVERVEDRLLEKFKTNRPGLSGKPYGSQRRKLADKATTASVELLSHSSESTNVSDSSSETPVSFTGVDARLSSL